MTIECEYDEVYSAPQVVSMAVSEAQAQELQGVFVNCFGDPGVRAVREKLKMPVFGGFEPAIYLGLGLGDTLGIVTVLKNVVPMIRGAIARAGLEKRVVCVRTLDLPVLESPSKGGGAWSPMLEYFLAVDLFFSACVRPPEA